jgi:arylsulfatase A-like enzyme
VRLTTVFWDEFKEANSAWDTHVRQEARLKDELCPGFDLAYSALIEDLESRGLLDETLVVVLSEHGRTPKLNKTPGGGREHWAGAFCSLLAGAGVRRGHVHGATDRIAGFPVDNPVSPKDVLATVYHLLGVDPETHLNDREGRPVPLAPGGQVLAAALA